jgi:hypothetical protein
MHVIQLKEHEQTQAMLQKVTQLVAKGDAFFSSLCSQIFTMVNDLDGFLKGCNNSIEELRARIKKLDVKEHAMINPIVQQAKFIEIQEADNYLDELFYANQNAKKQLHEFKPTVQTTYAKIHQLESVADKKW